MQAPLVHGSQLGPVCLTVRRHFIADGAGRLSPHYDVISYEAPTIMTYEELAASKLDGYKTFLCGAISAEPTTGNTQLINMLEENHCVSAKTVNMKWWGNGNRRLIVTMARQSLAETCDVYDATIAHMGTEVMPIDENIGLALGAMNSEAMDKRATELS